MSSKCTAWPGAQHPHSRLPPLPLPQWAGGGGNRRSKREKTRELRESLVREGKRKRNE